MPMRHSARSLVCFDLATVLLAGTRDVWDRRDDARTTPKYEASIA
jgi:hypothetical protein